jgi:hypothetical protein
MTYSTPNNALQLLTTEWMDDALPAIGYGRTQLICQHVPVMLDVMLAKQQV